MTTEFMTFSCVYFHCYVRKPKSLIDNLDNDWSCWWSHCLAETKKDIIFSLWKWIVRKFYHHSRKFKTNFKANQDHQITFPIKTDHVRVLNYSCWIFLFFLEIYIFFFIVSLSVTKVKYFLPPTRMMNLNVAWEKAFLYMYTVQVILKGNLAEIHLLCLH